MMKWIKPDTAESRKLKAKAIMENDVDTMVKINTLKDKEFVVVDDFMDLLMVSSLPDFDEIEILVKTEFKETLTRITSERTEGDV